MICKNPGGGTPPPNFTQGGGNGLPPPPLKPPMVQQRIVCSNSLISATEKLFGVLTDKRWPLSSFINKV